MKKISSLLETIIEEFVDLIQILSSDTALHKSDIDAVAQFSEGKFLLKSL